MSSPRGRGDSVGDVARLFDGGRLTLARHLAGLRKNALADLIDRTPTAVAAYEAGAKRPAPATVAKLSWALGVEPGFFLPGPQEILASAGTPHFRSLRSTTQAARDQAYAYGRLAVGIAAGLERHVELPVRDLPNFNAADPDFADRAAKLLRESWALPAGPVKHIIRSAENHGILVVFGPCQTASVDAYSFDNAHRPAILLNPLKQDYFRQRWDVAHELGHLLLHNDAEPGGKLVEDQANAFAASLLLPSEALVGTLPNKADWRKLARLKDYWGVSMQALLFRARRLGVMSDSSYRNAMVYLSSQGWRRREPGSSPVVEQPSLLPRAVELLKQVGISESDLASEARVPLSMFRLVTSRLPQVPTVSEDEPDTEVRSAVVPLFESQVAREA